MKAKLLARLERLEARSARRNDTMMRYGCVKRLPDTFTGEKHVVIVRREPAGPGRECCQFEERAGKAPRNSADEGIRLYLTEDEMNL